MTLQQLASKGVQDGHLSIAPETSFFKRTYKRVSNYAIETIDQTVPSLGWGHGFTVQVARNGDLSSELWAQFNINLAQLNDDDSGNDSVRWTNVLGHAMFTKICFEIGNNEIDSLTYDYLEIIHELTSDVNVNVDELVLRSESEAQLIEWANNGNTLDTDGNAIVQLWVKLPFWYTRARSQSLPIIALQYHDIRVKFTLRKKSELLVFSDPTNTTLDATFDGEIKDGCLAVNFVFLDSMERRLFASNAHEYLVRNIQCSDYHTKPSGSTKLSCTVVFNHPVTCMYWYIQKQTHLTALDYFNWERTDGMGDDTITSATVKFNGSERERARGPLFYRVVQSAMYFPRTPRKNMYMYSFAQHPCAWFPSGSVNLSRIDVTSLDFTFVATDANGDAFGEADIVLNRPEWSRRDYYPALRGRKVVSSTPVGPVTHGCNRVKMRRWCSQWHRQM